MQRRVAAEMHACTQTVPHAAAKKRLEWSTLLLFLLGLCSLASPHLMRHAHVSHAGGSGSPGSHAGRTSQRAGSRSSVRGGVRSELDRDRLHADLSGAGRASTDGAQMQQHLAILAKALPNDDVRLTAFVGLPNDEAPARNTGCASRGRAPPAA